MELNARKLFAVMMAVAALAGGASAQIPDLMTALDTGGRAMGLGGGTYVTDANTWSINANPAGLGYIRTTMFGIAYRNLPNSLNEVSGDFADLIFDTSLTGGANALTHLGYAAPLGNGTLGISYTRAGFIHDFRSGTGLADGTLTIRNYTELMKAQTDLFTVSWGRTLGNGTTNVGFGIVVANQYVKNNLAYDIYDGSTFIDSVLADNTGNSTGIGVVAGVQISPGGSSHSSIGLSIQTPISLSGSSILDAYYARIPGRASIGFATRTDSSNSLNYVVYGLQANYFFGGESNKILSRQNHTTFGGGFEYMMHRWGAQIPIRFGVSIISDGGNGFSNRNTVNFGVGYRPIGGDFSVDLSAAKPVDGNRIDLALSVTIVTGGK